VTIAGKYCESTDILITDIEMPALRPGDVIAVPAAGAYCLAMASNYNGMPRPEVLMVRDGQAHVMRRRETFDDLVAAEVF
jgi:diaminopimelate decarboxylase